MNMHNKLECYMTLGRNGLSVTKTLAYWAHSLSLANTVPDVLTFLANTELGWKCLQGTNAPAYFGLSVSDKEKSFIILTSAQQPRIRDECTGADAIELFFFINAFGDK